MFVRYYTHIPRPVEDVAHLLDDQPEHLLGGSADGNYERGGPVHLSLRVDGALPLSKEVLIRAGKTQHVADRAVLPITVVAAGSTGFFPRLEADLEVAPLGPNVTQLALSGTYRPPMGWLAIWSTRRFFTASLRPPLRTSSIKSDAGSPARPRPR